MTSFFKGVTFEAEIKNLALHDARGEKAPKEVLVRVTNQFTNKVSNLLVQQEMHQTLSSNDHFKIYAGVKGN